MPDRTTVIKQALIGQQGRLVKLTTPLVSVLSLLSKDREEKISGLRRLEAHQISDYR